MKKFVIALAFSMARAFAAEVQIMDTAVPVLMSHATADSRFQMDSTTGEGSVVVTVTEQRWTEMGGYYDQWGRYYPNRVSMPVVVFKDSVRVEGLALHGDQVIYAGRDGDVNCGRLGQSSVLRRPTIFLTGKCKLKSKLTGNWNNSRITVTMTTK